MEKKKELEREQRRQIMAKAYERQTKPIDDT
jgi:hypothetical protein